MRRGSKDQDFHPRDRSVDGELSVSFHQGMLPPPIAGSLINFPCSLSARNSRRGSKCRESVSQLSPVLPRVTQLCQESLAYGRAFDGPDP